MDEIHAAVGQQDLGTTGWCHPRPDVVPSIAPAQAAGPSLKTFPTANCAMLRIRGDRTSLLAALAAHWADQQLDLPTAGLRPPGLTPAPLRRRPDTGPAR